MNCLKNNRVTEISFFTQDAYILAQKLIGMYICRETDGQISRYRITETECYIGMEDTACHACKGKTKRTEIMWEKGGVCYVYLCYGIHNMLNIVSGSRGQPQAVLIRGVRGYDGPGKLTKAMKVDRSFNGENLIESCRIWLEEGDSLTYTATPRIGIAYAEEKDRNALWRFVAE
ncbi:MAG: DNA-3-methyladenine glycosylase [Oscillospiraceae bacterium]|nr:DNA-3-methyladenine glycosylase [Oscillospiraceae bacterium]